MLPSILFRLFVVGFWNAEPRGLSPRVSEIQSYSDVPSNQPRVYLAVDVFSCSMHQVLELVELASNPREERNASLGETVAAGIR